VQKIMPLFLFNCFIFIQLRHFEKLQLIRDISGKEVKKLEVEGYKMRKILEGKSFKPGIYFATLFVNGNSKESVKFTVTY
jgi:hypothetical protein